MPRALAIRYLNVGDDARAGYLARLARRTDSARACGHHLWAFEQADAPGSFVEFVETRDEGALRTALVQDELVVEPLLPDEPELAPGVAWRVYHGVAGAS